MVYDGIMMSKVTSNLNKELLKGRINKIYSISSHEILMTIRSQSKNYKLLVSIHPMYARVQLTSLSYPTPDFPNALTMLLRKHLEGAYIINIRQLGLERILILDVVGRNDFGDQVVYHMYIEIMGKHSNFILTYEDNKIIDCLKRVSPSMSKRILQPGAIYEFPPLIDKINPFTIDCNEVTSSFTKVYQGFSPELSNEMEYRIQSGEDFKDVLNQINESQSLYLYKHNDKEYFHIIPLKHINDTYKEYSLFDGLDKHFDLIDQKDRIKQQTSDLSKYITNEYTRNINKLNKLEKTLFESKNSEELRIKGEMLYTSLHLITKGMTSIIVDNYYDNTLLEIELDPKLDGKGNAKKYFQKYTKAKNSIIYLNEQIDKTKEEIAYFDSLKVSMDNASYYDALEIKEELENLGYLKKKKTKQLNKKKNKPHIETYLTKDNITIYIGKNNIQNDYLTFHHASKNDMWFHAKDMPGSHVIVHSENLDEYTIRLASTIAAYYSKGKNSSSVPVNYTTVRTLKKPSGKKLGQVILDHYKTIYIDPDDSFLDEIKKV
jgi:predicted ribosome quality control (RQC) complex YloA/Tae2 family protein